MIRTTLVIALFVGLVSATIPSAQAMDPPFDKHCLESGFRQCDTPVDWAKDAVDRALGDNDPRDWPCTCDPSPIGDPIA